MFLLCPIAKIAKMVLELNKMVARAKNRKKNPKNIKGQDK